jgi:hypothetical protein
LSSSTEQQIQYTGKRGIASWSANSSSLEGKRLGTKTIHSEMRKNKNKNKRKLLLLGSSHGREIGPMVQENLAIKLAMCNIFKPNNPLANVLEDIGKIHKGITKQNNIIIVGLSGNILGRNYHYSI